MKKCTKCGKELSEDCFAKDSTKKDGLYSSCKECRKKETYLKYYYSHTNQLKDKRNIKKDFINFLKTDCVKCGEKRRYLIQFHHINNADKEFNITGMLNCSYENIAFEADKCVCLCSNCHDEFHYFYGKQPKKPIEELTEYLGRNPYDV